MSPEIYSDIESELGKPFLRNVPLSGQSSFGIGGPADAFFRAETLEDLSRAVRSAIRHGARCFVMGGGTNILFDDRGFRGLVVKNAASGLKIGKDGATVEAVSGTSLAGLVEFSVSHGLRGLEGLVGIPGTVGGAVFGNAGAFGRSIGESLVSAVVVERSGEEAVLAGGHLCFSYRRSGFRDTGSILLRATFRLVPGDEKDMRQEMASYLEQRKRRHPAWPTASAGCYFKNPLGPDGKRIAAGRLLEEVGASALSRGAAAVSAAHCNFIVNRGGATAEDVLGLAAELKRRVKERFGLDLEEEVIYLPATA